MNKYTTRQSLTRTQIGALRNEAIQASDFVMIAVCDLALDGEFDCANYTTLDRSEERRMLNMTRTEAYDVIVQCINDAAEAAQ